MIYKIKWEYFLYLVALIFFIYHFLILSVSPIVWIDEVCFNSITLDHLKNGTYFFTADRSRFDGWEAVIYGPVFFLLNGCLINFFGNSIFYARLLGLAAGLLICIIIFFHLKKSGKENKMLFWIIIFSLITDPFFTNSIHNGRVDSLAILFYLSATFLVFYDNKYPLPYKSYFIWIASGTFYSLSILTTPRIIALSFPLMILFIILSYRNKFNKYLLLKILLWISIPVVAYSIWIYSAFGSFKNFLLYLDRLKTEEPKHLTGGLNIPMEVMPLFFTALFILIIYLISNFKKIEWRLEIIFYLTFIATFYFLIGNMGLYSVFVIPFFYLLIFELIRRINLNHSYLRGIINIAIVTLLVFNLSIVTLKSFILLTIDYEPRKYEPVNNFIKENIPAGAKVAGDELYYYPVVNNGSQFQLLKSYQLEFTSTEKYAREVFDYDYLIISNRYEKVRPHLAEYYFSHAKLEKIAEFKTVRNKNLSQKLAAFGIYTFALDGYDGVIYKRKR